MNKSKNESRAELERMGKFPLLTQVANRGPARSGHSFGSLSDVSRTRECISKVN